uniref:Uncharacterized protein n=1 Tax=Macrostomum lignano TaxID=282301 RepID=A0A1I8FE68_9PLAT
MTQQPVTPTNQGFEVTHVFGSIKKKSWQALHPHRSAARNAASSRSQQRRRTPGRHSPACMSTGRQTGADIDTVASQLRNENRALRRRVRQLEGKLKTASSSGQSESMAASAASQSEAARREWGRREAQLLARLQAAEAARGSLESRTVALEKELKEMTRLSRPISVVSNGASNAPASASAAAATPPVPTPTSALLTAENLARHARTGRQFAFVSFQLR